MANAPLLRVTELYVRIIRMQLIHVMENERINTGGGYETQVLCKCKTIEYGNAVVRWAFKQLACCLLLGLIVLLNI